MLCCKIGFLHKLAVLRTPWGTPRHIATATLSLMYVSELVWHAVAGEHRTVLMSTPRPTSILDSQPADVGFTTDDRVAVIQAL